MSEKYSAASKYRHVSRQGRPTTDDINWI